MDKEKIPAGETQLQVGKKLTVAFRHGVAKPRGKFHLFFEIARIYWRVSVRKRRASATLHIAPKRREYSRIFEKFRKI